MNERHWFSKAFANFVNVMDRHRQLNSLIVSCRLFFPFGFRLQQGRLGTWVCSKMCQSSGTNETSATRETLIDHGHIESSCQSLICAFVVWSLEGHSTTLCTISILLELTLIVLRQDQSEGWVVAISLLPLTYAKVFHLIVVTFFCLCISPYL